ncbi:hypothetical protein Droror1_Dr00023532 [Drosera rotundifolia]
MRDSPIHTPTHAHRNIPDKAKIPFCASRPPLLFSSPPRLFISSPPYSPQISATSTCLPHLCFGDGELLLDYCNLASSIASGAAGDTLGTTAQLETSGEGRNGCSLFGQQRRASGEAQGRQQLPSWLATTLQGNRRDGGATKDCGSCNDCVMVEDG